MVIMGQGQYQHRQQQRKKRQGQEEQRSQKPLEPEVLRICISCQSVYDLDNTISFEQGLIQDRDFCAKCFNEFMNVEYEANVTSHFWY
jgi:hypothetical protein